MYGDYVVDVWWLYGRCMVLMWQMYGAYVVDVWGYMADIWWLYGRYVVILWQRKYGMCMVVIW